MTRKYPLWLFVVALIIIAGAGYVQDEYGTNYEIEYIKEKKRADSLQKIVDSFNTCYKWNNEKHNY